MFPGGAAEDGEDARTAAARELFEEAGVLLARDAGAQAETLESPSQEQLRKRILGGVPAAARSRRPGSRGRPTMLVPWSHWITPSVETKRFSARFFVERAAGGQEPHFDATETVDQVWVTPADALARAAELQLPPPQMRTCWELAQCNSIDDGARGRARARRGAASDHAAPRCRASGPCCCCRGIPSTLRGTGDSAPLTYRPRWAIGPSRFVLEDRAWKHVDGPGSTTAG